MRYWRVCLSWVWHLSYGVLSPPCLLSTAHLWLCFKNLRTSCRSLKKIELVEDLYSVFKDILDSGTMTLCYKESCSFHAVSKKKERMEKNYLKFEYISAHFHIEFLYTQVWKNMYCILWFCDISGFVKRAVWMWHLSVAQMKALSRVDRVYLFRRLEAFDCVK